MTMLADPAARSYAASRAGAASTRDPRLDVFRGLAMFIILIAHVPGNFLALWIPARFGFSDATEIFVFCSGMASAIAFGRVFDTRGWLMGTARVAHRCWQVYWAHIGLFLTIAMMMALFDSVGFSERSYVSRLNLVPFFEGAKDQVMGAQAQLIGLMTLTYVPNYFDILPMYLVVLAMMPVVMALARVNLWLVAGFIAVVWLGAQMGRLGLPAEPWSAREWFFNPFGWQLVFFTGFAFMRGWLPQPPVTRGLLLLAGVVVVATVPFAYFRLLNAVPELREAAKSISFLTQKSDFGLLRYVHFLALAYLAWAAAGFGGARLRPMGDTAGQRLFRQAVAVVEKVGQQSLAVFIFSMVAAQAMGALLDVTGRAMPLVLLVNLAGFAALVGVALLVGWFKSQPWKARRA
ncbi:OpgC domain-containing protein [Fertoebacter nigrum]|uniref:OpgC domain-containing protein n=1 Tax=Fertoeibacter niger TaxID=2656921 RepID=A0A8X8H5B8_9RHOB|nr:OpgC domain-containing protein [Fertoeibacter niger]NUB43291.1 OpgC domain-containing protein [Fertoeibacter niger]